MSMMTASIETAMEKGNLVNVMSNEEAIEKFDYILRTCGSDDSGADVFRQATHFLKNPQVQAFSVSNLDMGYLQRFRVLNIVFKSTSGKNVKIINANGNVRDVFAYVYNIDAPDLSELGSIYFERRADGEFYRYA